MVSLGELLGGMSKMRQMAATKAPRFFQAHHSNCWIQKFWTWPTVLVMFVYLSLQFYSLSIGLLHGFITIFTEFQVKPVPYHTSNLELRDAKRPNVHPKMTQLTLWWTNIAIENGPVEIVDFPIKNGGSFHCYVAVHQRVTHAFSQFQPVSARNSSSPRLEVDLYLGHNAFFAAASAGASSCGYSPGGRKVGGTKDNPEGIDVYLRMYGYIYIYKYR